MNLNEQMNLAMVTGTCFSLLAYLFISDFPSFASPIVYPKEKYGMTKYALGTEVPVMFSGS